MNYIKIPVTHDPKIVGCSTLIISSDAHIILAIPIRGNDNEHMHKADEIVRVLNSFDDLLEACKAQEEADKLHVIYAETGKLSDYDTWMKADAKAIMMRQSAIAKAEGESE